MSALNRCPECRQTLLPGEEKCRKVLYCPTCNAIRDPEMRQNTALKIPGLQPGRQQRTLREKEEELVEAIRQALSLKGYVVFRVGQWMAHKSGTDEGTPDLLIERESWPLPMALMMEVKVRGGDISPVQQELARRGLTIIVWSVDEALRAVAQAEEVLR